MNTFIRLIHDFLFSIGFYLAPRFANVLLFIAIGRLAGPTEAGVFTLATTYLLIFVAIMRGMDDLIIRQVSREPLLATRYLTNFLLLRLVLSIFLYGALWVLVTVVFNYPADVSRPILILGLSLIPDSLTNVCQSILLGQQYFRLPVYVLAGVSLLKLVFGVIVLISGGNLLLIAYIWLGSSLLGLFIMLAIVRESVGGIRRTDFVDFELLKTHQRAILIFLLLTTLVTLETQTDTILLSILHGSQEVGWYGAATTIAYSLIVFSQAYQLTIYPRMNRHIESGSKKLVYLYTQSMRYLGIIVLPIVAGVALLAFRIVPLIFGDEFSPTIIALQILIFTLIFIFLNEPNIRILLTHNRQNKILIFLLVSVSVNIVLNLFLTPVWGASGAATARVFSAMFLFILNYAYVTHVFVNVSIFKLLFKPLLATVFMTLIILPIRSLGLVVPILVGGGVYATTLIALGEVSSSELRFAYQVLLKFIKKVTVFEKILL